MRTHDVVVGGAGDYEVVAYLLTGTRNASRLVRLKGVDDLVVDHKKTID